jgi:hypothetical protein
MKGNHVPLKRPCSNYESGLAPALRRSRLTSSLARLVLARTFSRETHSTAMLAGQTTLDVFSDSAQCEKLKAGARAETIRDTPAELCVPHLCGHLATCSRRLPQLRRGEWSASRLADAIGSPHPPVSPYRIFNLRKAQ